MPPATPVPTPVATPAVTAQATPTPTPYIKVAPVTLHFVEKEISCPIEPVGLEVSTDKDGEPILDESGEPVYTMGTIDSEKVAAWLQEGPSPGEYGNALINGHITWKKVAGVFSVLSDLEIGEQIAVTYADGSVRYFEVTSNDVFPIDDYPEWVMSLDTGDTRMTLITCHGDWNSSAGTRNERAVVVAKPVEQDGTAQ